MRNAVTTAAGAFVLLLPLCAPAAQAQLALPPTIVEPRSYPGGLSTFTLSVVNNGDRPLDCTASRYAMEVRGSGLPTPVDDAPRSCRDWLEVQPASFTLSPKQGQRLVCRVCPPKDAAGGDYAPLSCLGQPQTTDRPTEDAGGSAPASSSTTGSCPW